MLHPVLVVEDDRKIARVVALYLEEAGYRVVQAATGRAALEEAARELPLLVVLDLMLPDIGGEQVIQELQALGDVPVIILTSRSSEEDRVVGFALGADDYVVKPFSPRELVSRVKAVLKRARRDDLSDAGSVSFEQGRLAEEYDKDNADPARIAAIRKEIVDLEAKIQVAADKSGLRPWGHGRGHDMMAGGSGRCGCR